MLKLSEIWIYPVKSLGGIRMASAEVMPKGLRYDRRWILIDHENKFMTQREHPRMALFKMSLDQNKLQIHYSGETLDLFPDLDPQGEPVQTIVWNDQVSVNEVSPSHSSWISERLGHPCRLMAFPEKNSRPVDKKYSLNDEHVSLADGYPFLIIGQASLDDLNSRMNVPVPMNRFRPNFVFTGGKAFEEDQWKEFHIGDVKFTAVKPCARCVLTTVDQETAEKGKEPLKTLATFREQNNNVLFGMNLLGPGSGVVMVGDEIRKG